MQNRYRELTRKNLDGLLNKLFAEFTGLHFHVAWAPSLTHAWKTEELPPGCSHCCRRTGITLTTPAYCRRCGPRQLARLLSAEGDGHRFLCRRGVRNYWFPIRVRHMTVGIAYLQALTEGKGGASAWQSPAHGKASVQDRVEFDRASRLLRLIVQHVQTLDLAELRNADLTNARRAVTALENEQDRLRKELERTVPAPARILTPAKPETRAGQIVRRLLEDVQRNYTQPLSLQQCAADLAMNASYLSTLFSRAVGLPFKSYLTELRLARAKELLGDPKRSVSEVAREVGYASENRFRSAFKKLCGLSPRSWRETFLPVKLISLGWLMQNQEFVDSLRAFIV